MSQEQFFEEAQILTNYMDSVLVSNPCRNNCMSSTTHSILNEKVLSIEKAVKALKE